MLLAICRICFLLCCAGGDWLDPASDRQFGDRRPRFETERLRLCAKRQRSSFKTLLGLSRGADRAIAETWFCETQQPKSANPPPSFSGGRIPADFYFAIPGERRPCFLQPAGANWSRTARRRALVTRPGNCCLAASQSASPEEVSPRAPNSATRRSYHMCRSRSDSGEPPFVNNLNRAVPAVGLPAASNNGSRLASSCLATSPAAAHPRITSSCQNSMSIQASRYFDTERNSTGESSWSSAGATA
jgi:hypothetical protein